MPRLILKNRDSDLIELMDDPDCDLDQLERTYDWFSILNPWLARWNAIYRTYVRPSLHADRPSRILDIGCGGGDLLRFLGAKAKKDGFAVSLLGVDPDERAIKYAREQYSNVPIEYRAVHSSVLVQEDQRFDIIVSNHVLHHLDPDQFKTLINDSEQLSDGLVIHNDICRDDLAWLAFWPVGGLCRKSFILEDGLRSIRRAWHPDELKDLVPSFWTIQRQAPFRTLLIHRKAS